MKKKIIFAVVLLIGLLCSSCADKPLEVYQPGPDSTQKIEVQIGDTSNANTINCFEVLKKHKTFFEPIEQVVNGESNNLVTYVGVYQFDSSEPEKNMYFNIFSIEDIKLSPEIAPIVYPGDFLCTSNNIEALWSLRTPEHYVYK